MTDNDARVSGPAPRPCDSCPYRQDVPSAVWHPDEYAKLRAYDLDTTSQPAGLFQCHQHEGGDPRARLCAGWVGCHGEELLGLRLALITGAIDGATFERSITYQSPVPLFTSGAAAAAHGMRDATHPSADARRLVRKIVRRRGDMND